MSTIKLSYAPLTEAQHATHFNMWEMPFEQVHTLTCCNNYSPLEWKDGVRKAANFVAALWLGLDIDGTLPLEAAKERLSGYQEVCIVTTKTHQLNQKSGKAIVPADRYRIIINLGEPITDLAEYKTIITNLIDQFDADPSCKDGGRFFYGNPSQQVWYS